MVIVVFFKGSSSLCSPVVSKRYPYFLVAEPFFKNADLKITGDRTYKLCSDRTPEPGRSVKSLGEPRDGSHEQGPLVLHQWGLQWGAGAGIEFQIDYFTAVGVRYRYRSTGLGTYPPISAGEVRANVHRIAIELVLGGE
jgi:hypothetical protein